MRWLYGFAVATAVFGVTLGGFFSGINATDPAVGQAAQPVICVSGCSGGGAVFGPTATGSAAANPPVLMGGTVDGTATGNVQGAAVKPASTAPLATDPALVVAISPNSVNANGAATAANSAPVVNPIATIAGAASVNVTPTDCSSTIATGGTAQVLIAAQTTLHGFTVANIDSTSGSGEPLWFSFTGTAAASSAGSYPLAAPTATTFASLASWTSPLGFGTNHAISIIGVTSGHKYSCTWW